MDLYDHLNVHFGYKISENYISLFHLYILII